MAAFIATTDLVSLQVLGHMKLFSERLTEKKNRSVSSQQLDSNLPTITIFSSLQKISDMLKYVNFHFFKLTNPAFRISWNLNVFAFTLTKTKDD